MGRWMRISLGLGVKSGRDWGKKKKKKKKAEVGRKEGRCGCSAGGLLGGDPSVGAE